ncbi:hypothetical protein ACWD0J_37120 [Streptomyces sp. NPDC003011]
MSEQTPSQAEGEREQDTAPDQQQETPSPREVARTTPSQAEGEGAHDESADEGTDDRDKEGSKAWESGWSGP